MVHVGRFIGSTFGLTLLVAIITILGALIFQRIEGQHELQTRVHAAKARQKIFVLAQRLSMKGEGADWSKLVAQVDRYREKLQEAWQAGTDELTVELPTKWNFWGSIYYCFTLFTTIGYGNVFPSTTIGKLTTLVYGILTIPLCSLLVSRLSSGLVRLSKAVHLMTLDSSGIPIGLREAYNRADSSFNFRVLPSVVAMLIYLILGAGVYSYAIGGTAMGWSALDSIYFAFVTVTTVGFGDLVPDTDTFLNIISLIYILFGLALSGIVFGRLTLAFDNWLCGLGGANLATETLVADATTKRTIRSTTTGATTSDVHHPKQA